MKIPWKQTDQGVFKITKREKNITFIIVITVINVIFRSLAVGVGKASF